MMENYVIYCRVSTREQGDSGLGLDAQLNTCRLFVESKGGNIVGEYSDIKSGSSRNRAGLLSALSEAKKHDAVLVFAKLDRMARDSEYAHSIRNSGVKLYFCDFPEINSLLFGILVAVAQNEKELGQKRTKDALGVIKQKLANGETHVSKNGREITRLGGERGRIGKPMSETLNDAFRARISSDPNRRRQWLSIQEMLSRGCSYESVAATLNAIGDTPVKGGKWTRGQVYRAANEWGKYFET
jgi:DNA invertase Pin-like site-specific DNA recombinase